MSKMKAPRQLVQESVSVIVPAYNEETAVCSLVCAIQEVLDSQDIPYEINSRCRPNFKRPWNVSMQSLAPRSW